MIVPATLPKPDLMPLTGGFRRTPVLQIGADIYCDTLRIAMELDRRCPEPPLLLPESGAGFDGILATWAERMLMWPTARYVTGMNRDALPETFFRDRAEMRGHPVPTREEVAAGLPHEEGQLHLMLGWVEDLLAGERRFASGRLPRLADLALYQRLWWLRALDGRAAHALDDFPRTRDWMARIAAVGHGERSELSPRDALRIASHRTQCRTTHRVASRATTSRCGAGSESRPRTSRRTRWKASSSTPPGKRLPYGATTPK